LKNKRLASFIKYLNETLVNAPTDADAKKTLKSFLICFFDNRKRLSDAYKQVGGGQDDLSYKLFYPFHSVKK